MNICPLCNGFRELLLYCENCGRKLEDKGKIMDYFDDYSPYMEIDLTKREDGYPSTLRRHECVHLFYCLHCDHEQIQWIKE